MHSTPPPPLHPVSEHMFIAWKSYCTFWNEVRKTNRLGRDRMAPKIEESKGGQKGEDLLM